MRISRRQSMLAMAAVTAVPLNARAAAGGRPPIRLVVLDIGGTLIPDHGEVPTAMQSALKHGGIDVSLAEINDWRGASKRGMIRHFVELRAKPGADRGKLIDTVYADFSAQADTAYKNVKPIPGVEKALDEMRARKMLLATSTGFGRELNDTIFARLGWKGRFDASVTSDDVVDGRPAPYMIFHAMEATHVNGVLETIAVGDTPLDLQAATNGGVRGVIGVLTGVGTEERLAREPHTHIVPSVADLPTLLQKEF